MPPHVALRCDSWPELGVGHVIRSLALGDALAARGVAVTLFGEVRGVEWVQDQVRVRGLEIVPAPADPAELTRAVTTRGIDAVVIDGYHVDVATGGHLRAAGVTVLSVLDDDFGAGQAADVYLDQNLGARPPAGSDSADGAEHLLGLDYVLFRDQVLEHRRTRHAVGEVHDPPRVLGVFGGTDPYAAGPVLARMLADTGAPFQAVFIAARAEVADALADVPLGPGQTIDVHSPTPNLAELAASCDLALTASGSSVWEFLCLGVPAATVCVVDNQLSGYAAVSELGVALPVGLLWELRSDPQRRAAGVAALTHALQDPESRIALARDGLLLVDGRGRDRVVDALLDAIARRRSRS